MKLSGLVLLWGVISGYSVCKILGSSLRRVAETQGPTFGFLKSTAVLAGEKYVSVGKILHLIDASSWKT